MTHIQTLDYSHEQSYSAYIMAREAVRRALMIAPQPLSALHIEEIAHQHRLLPSTVMEIAIFHKLLERP